MKTNPPPGKARTPIEYIGDPVAYAAWLYYSEQRTQNEIALELGVSRQTVANYLSDARSRGLVTIRLSGEILQRESIGQTLSETYGLEAVHILPDPTEQDPQITRDRIAGAGAHVVKSLLQENSILGVAFGRTMYALGEAMQPQEFPKATVVQVAGSSIDGRDTAPEFCTALIASRLSAKCVNLHAPAFLSDKELCYRLINEPSIKRQFELMAKTDILVFGVGELLPNTTFSDAPFLTDQVRNDYISNGATAVIFGRFIDHTGNEVAGPLSDRTLSIDLETAKSIPKRLVVSGGAEKTSALHATLSSGYATHFVTDMPTAKRLHTYTRDNH
ncbi:MAG: sugar-binding transcriptional regulator [Hyphomicrobiales bacterium]